MKPITFLGFFPDYEVFFFKQIPDSTVFNPSESQKSYFLSTPKFIRNKLLTKSIKNYILNNQNDFYILNENRLVVDCVNKIIEKYRLNLRGCILIRNPILNNLKGLNSIRNLENKGIKVLTFDRLDSINYSWGLYNQFASRVMNGANISIKYDFAFVGRDKGRAQLIESLIRIFKNQNLSFFPYIVSGNNCNVTYQEYIQLSLHAKCIVDIIQQGQTGLTLRPIEALLYKRKLLTNNKTIISEEFYHPNNILVFENNLEELDIKDFLNLPLVDISEEVVRKYTTEELIKNLLKFN